MPRINQLPAASSVAQTDVLAIDTTDKTYKVPRSVLAPAPYIATIPTGQWSGSGSDRYITVTASNVTADAMLYPFYDNASAAMLNGPVWVIPAAGSFTIHTSAIPSGTVTISVLLAGIVGEAQYQVLADVYSKSQVDSIVSQSTAFHKGDTFMFNGAQAPFRTLSNLSEIYFNYRLPKPLGIDVTSFSIAITANSSTWFSNGNAGSVASGATASNIAISGSGIRFSLPTAATPLANSGFGICELNATVTFT